MADFGINSAVLANRVKMQIRQTLGLNQGKLSATEYSEALFKLAAANILILVSRPRSTTAGFLRYWRQNDAAKKPPPRWMNAGSKPECAWCANAICPAGSDPELSMPTKTLTSPDRITELHAAEEQGFNVLNAARNQGWTAVPPCHDRQWADQAFSDVGFDFSGAQSDEQKYANQIKSRWWVIYLCRKRIKIIRHCPAKITS